MGWIAKDVPTLVFMLLPGFVSASIFYTLTTHPKASEFERLIQALIFTAILKSLTFLVGCVLFAAGRIARIGIWDSNVELAWSIILAVPLGLFFVYMANNDKFHSWMRGFGITSRTSYPSEWYSTFLREKRWVVLHLLDGRRVYGWPFEWPDQPDRGHFVIEQAEWLLENAERAPLYGVDVMLIPAADVRMVEFIKQDDEVKQSRDELERVKQLILQQRKDANGSESPAASSESTTTAGPRTEERQRGIHEPAERGVKADASAPSAVAAEKVR